MTELEEVRAPIRTSLAGIRSALRPRLDEALALSWEAHAQRDAATDALGHRAANLFLDVQSRAASSVEACLVHASAVARLTMVPAWPLSAQVVARSAAEGAGLATWLLEPGISPSERIARHLGRADEEITRALEFQERAEPVEGNSAVEFARIRAATQEKQRLVEELCEELDIRPQGIGPTRLAGRIIDATEFDILSAATHSRLGALSEVEAMQHSTEHSFDLFMHTVSVVARAAVVGVSVVREFSLGLALEPSEVAQFADSLGLQTEALLIPDGEIGRA